MRRWAWWARAALGCAAIVVFGHATGATEPALESLLAARTKLGARIVRIVARAIDGRVGLGSGVPIGPDQVVTNCHVTRRASAIAVVVGSGFNAPTHPVVAQASDAEHDLCVLQTETPLPVASVPIGPSPRVGDRVVGLGFSGGFGLRVHPGEVIGLFAFHGAEVLQTSTAFNAGASGGGLFNSANELVGIMTFRGRTHGQFYSLPVAWIGWVLAQRSFVPVKPQMDDRAFWERDAEDQPMFLRANALEATEDWTQLELLARDWLAREPDDPAAWLAIGKALLHQGRLDAVLRDLEACLEAHRSHDRPSPAVQVAHAVGDRPEPIAALRDRLRQLGAPLARTCGRQALAARSGDGGRAAHERSGAGP